MDKREEDAYYHKLYARRTRIAIAVLVLFFFICFFGGIIQFNNTEASFIANRIVTAFIQSFMLFPFAVWYIIR